MQTNKISAYGASGKLFNGQTLQQMEITREPPKKDEVLIEILYCGVCHSDIHQVNNDWSNTIYPCVPGHEIIGRIVEKGNAVTKFAQGDIVGVGCMIDSCGHCKPCREGEEQHCLGPVGCTMTYNGYFKPDGSGYNTFGGYAESIVVKESFLLHIPASLDIKKAAPILCAGVTTYSPLKHAGIKAGDKVGIIGIGGLGHMAVKIAKAMGADVTAITSKEEKRNDAMKLGADNVIVSDYEGQMKMYENNFNFLLCTIPEPFDVNPYVCLLAPRGRLVTVGLLAPYKEPLNNMEVAKLGRSVEGSLIGGIAETQEVLDFCAKYNILPEVEIIDIEDINEAFKKIEEEEVRFRYVIDMKTLKNKN